MLYAYRDAADSPVPVKMVFGVIGTSSFYPEDRGCFGLDQNHQAAAVFFRVMAGTCISPDLFGTPAYEEEINDICAPAWIDENSVPSLCTYGAHDKMQAFPASQRLAATLQQYRVPHDLIVFEHSGHGLQNDDDKYGEYLSKILQYLDTYMPID